MKKILALTVLICAALLSKAQMPYDFSYKKEAYVPLTNAISLNDTNLWSDNSFAIPLGFKVQLGDKELDTVYLYGNSILSSDTTKEVMDGLVFIDAYLQDRGALDGTKSASPVRYEITGPKGNRICKIEIANAGFYDERDLYSTMDDSVNIQLWIYESGSIVEMRYGPSQISNPSDYFISQVGPIVGYADYFDPNDASGMVYLLSGDYDSPTLDSFSFTITGYTLSSYPADSTVYTFKPKKTLDVARSEVLKDVKIYPTAVQNMLYVNTGAQTGVQYSIINTAGQSMNINGEVSTTQRAIDVSSLPPGAYILRLRTNGVEGAYRFSRL